MVIEHYIIITKAWVLNLNSFQAHQGLLLPVETVTRIHTKTLSVENVVRFIIVTY